MSSNTITLTGFTSKDGGELRFTQSGAAVCSFRVTGTHQRYDRDQAKHVDAGEPLWYGVETWRELAEQVAEQIGTGQSRLVTVTGHIERRTYTTNGGEQRTVDEIKADSVCVHPPKQRQPNAGQSWTQQPPAQGQGAQGQWSGGQQSSDPWASGGQQAFGGGGMPANVHDSEPPFAP